MDQDRWNAVDAYIVDRLISSDEALDSVLDANAAGGLPAIDVSTTAGKFLHLITRISGAKRVLEIGTLGGFSTIWFARALPAGGKVVTLEYEPEHADIARANIARAGVAERVEIRLGAALDSLAALKAEGAAPFDLVFIDADKENNPNYLQWAMTLGRPGTVIISDNVVRDGEILDAASTDPDVQGMRRFFDMMGAEPRLSATALQTVGIKGWDGFSIAILD